MNDWQQAEEKGRRGLRLVSIFAIAATVLVGAAIVLLSRGGEPETVRRRAAAEEGGPPPDATPDRRTQKSVDTPTKDDSEARVALAMDLSNARALVQTLKEAAAFENASLRDSTLQALTRYGRLARGILAEERDLAADHRVREALEKALARAY